MGVGLLGQENAGKPAVDPNNEREVDPTETSNGVAQESLLGEGAPHDCAAKMAQSSSQVVSQHEGSELHTTPQHAGSTQLGVVCVVKQFPVALVQGTTHLAAVSILNH